MAKNQTRRLKPEDLSRDEAAFNAMKQLNAYAPPNPNHTVNSLQQALDQMRARQESEDQQAAALATARDNAVSAEWAFHNLMLGVKDAVKAQYGKDSNEVQALGLKKTSEYKSGTGRPKTKTAP
jgi:hypothetical protein